MYRLLVVSATIRDGLKSVTGVTYGGAALTPIAAQSSPYGNSGASLWYLVNPRSARRRSW